jgi:hypothetical protein
VVGLHFSKSLIFLKCFRLIFFGILFIYFNVLVCVYIYMYYFNIFSSINHFFKSLPHSQNIYYTLYYTSDIKLKHMVFLLFMKTLFTFSHFIVNYNSEILSNFQFGHCFFFFLTTELF